MTDHWNSFVAAYERLCASFGRRCNDDQAQRWHQKLSWANADDVVGALELLEETGSAFPTLPKVLEILRAAQKSSTSLCVACHGTRVVFVNKLDGRRQLPNETWRDDQGLVKGPAECHCVARGRPLVDEAPVAAVQREAISTQDEFDLGPDVAGMWAVD